MYHDLKTNFWWIRMKKDIADYVTRYLTYQNGALETRWTATTLTYSSFEMGAYYHRSHRWPTENY